MTDTVKTTRVECVYVAGPMSGYEELNAPAFERACVLIQGEGHEPINPQFIPPWEEHTGSCPTGYPVCYLWADIIVMLQRATMLYALPGWSASRGASLEVRVAETCGIPIRFLTDDELKECTA